MHCAGQIVYAGSVTYEYDNDGRLVAVLDATNNGSSYSYDPVGNLLAISNVSSATCSVFSLSRDYGPVATPVTINGDGFSTNPSQNTVKFAAVIATVSSSTVTQIVTTVPTGLQLGQVQVSVTAPTGSASNQPIFTVTAQ